MKALRIFGLLALLLSASRTWAAIVVPSDGSDGALIVTNDTVIDLSQALSAPWNTNNAAHAGRGVYDASKWAVVFKYSKVVVNGGFTVTFANHPSRAPVVWLVSGDVTVDGNINLDGQGAQGAPALAEPGPGGFRGGSGNFAPGAAEAPGFGPGGGNITQLGECCGQSFAAPGVYGGGAAGNGETYGNPSLLPLIGGSGGGGFNQNGTGGGAGAGAILIASGGVISVAGSIHANGGGSGGSAGAGGGIRLVADTLDGAGVVQCLAGSGHYSGGVGRIRLERVSNANTLQVTPDPSVVPLASGATPLIWLPTNAPSVQVVSIGGLTAPVDPRAGFNTVGADVTLPQVSTTTVVVVTTNIEQASTVLVRATPRSNGGYNEVTAGLDQVLSQNPLVIQWKANVPVQNGYSAVIARVIRP